MPGWTGSDDSEAAVGQSCDVLIVVVEPGKQIGVEAVDDLLLKEAAAAGDYYQPDEPSHCDIRPGPMRYSAVLDEVEGGLV
jgi:hypothetical protein